MSLVRALVLAVMAFTSGIQAFAPQSSVAAAAAPAAVQRQTLRRVRTTNGGGSNISSWPQHSVTGLEWDSVDIAPASSLLQGMESSTQMRALFVLSAAALASTRAPTAIGAIAAGMSGAAAACTFAVRRASAVSAERVFLLTSVAAIVAVGVVGGISFGSAMCAVALVA